MSTRALTYFYNQTSDREPFTCIYKHWDGYPEGWGASLANFLVSIKVVNGIDPDEIEWVANGMGCLVAQFIKQTKDRAGDLYVYPPDLSQDCWQDYEYHVWSDRVRVQNRACDNIFEGTWLEFEVWATDLGK